MDGKSKFMRAVPYADDVLNMPVNNLDDAIPYYENIMGFTVVSRSGEPCKSATLERDGVQIGLAENGGDPTQEGAFFEVDNVEAAFEEFKSNGLVREEAEYKVDKRGDRMFRLFFLIAPDQLCYNIGEEVQS
jgi:catechol 2,3-dioxygenase-like lactoylglutathione lyase family enzyme